jgi:hypothetical protein
MKHVEVGYSLRGKNVVRISFIIVLLVVYSNQKWTVGPGLSAQNYIGPEDLVTLDNATISTNLFSTCLEVVYTRYGGISEATDLDSQVTLLLSLNNVSWVEVKNYTFDEKALDDNVTMTFRICNTLFQPFPFDVEEGEILYVCIGYMYSGGSILRIPTCRTPSFAIVVPTDIIRPWYFTIDWTLPRIFGMLFLFLFAVFCISKRDRSKMDPML